MGIAGGLHGGVKGEGVGIVLGAPPVQHRRQVGAAAEPRLGGDDEARVHMHGRHVRIVQMGDQRNAGGEEARVSAAPGMSLRNSGANSPNTVETWTPTFSNTRPFIIAMTPPPPACAAWSVRFQGLRTNRPAARSPSGAPAGRAPPAPRRRPDPIAQRFEPGAGAVFACFDLASGHVPSEIGLLTAAGACRTMATAQTLCPECHKSARLSVH